MWRMRPEDFISQGMTAYMYCTYTKLSMYIYVVFPMAKIEIVGSP